MSERRDHLLVNLTAPTPAIDNLQIRASARGFSRAVLTSARMHSRNGRLTLRDLPKAHPFQEPAYQYCGAQRANQLLPFAITDHVGGGLDRIP